MEPGMTCKRAREAIRDLGAGIASAALPTEVSQHLSACPECEAMLREELELTGRLRSAAGAIALPASAEAAMCGTVRRSGPVGRTAWPARAMAVAASLLVVGASGWLWWSSVPTATDVAPGQGRTAAVVTEEPSEPAPAVREPVVPAVRPAVEVVREPVRVARASAASRPLSVYTTRPAVRESGGSTVVVTSNVAGGWGADGPAPIERESVRRDLGLDVAASALATEVRLDAFNVDSGIAGATSTGGRGMALDVPISSIPDVGVEWKVEAL